jgi:hypothetical protein
VGVDTAFWAIGNPTSHCRSLPFTQASLRRAIEAVRKAGLSVTGIRPDGTLIVHESTHFIAGVAPIARDETLSKWEDVKA